MAPRKDAELVVRARDQASKTVRNVTDAIDDLKGSQEELVDSSKRSDSALDNLQNAFSGLQKQLRGFTVAGRLEAEFNKAQAAIVRLDESLKSSAQESARLNREAEETSAEYDRQVAAVNRAKVALEQEQAARRESKAAMTAANAELRRGIAERDKLTAAEKRLTEQLDRQQAKVREAEERYSRLGAQLAATTEPTRRLTQQYERSGVALDKARASLTGIQDRLVQNRAATVQAAAGITELEVAANGASNEFAEQNARLTKAQEAYRETGAAAQATGKFLGSLKSDLDRVTESIDRQVGARAKARTEFRQFGAALDEAGVAVQNLGGLLDSALQDGLAEQTAAVEQAKREWYEAEDAALALANQLSKLEAEANSSLFGGPAAEDVRKLEQALDEAVIASRTAEKEFLEQRTGLKELGAIAQETGGDVDTLAQRQERFAAVQAKTAAAITRVRKEAEASVASSRKQSAATDLAAGSNQRLGGATNSAARGMREARTASELLSQAYQRLYGNSRQALSIQQRIRGELLALTSSYLGFFAALQGVNFVRESFESLEAATVKLNVAFDSPEQVGKELDIIRDTAGRLGLEFGTLADQYAKLQIATKGSNVTSGDTRKLFISISEAARVLQLDNERLKRTFTAFEQIAQKGVVSMEELRQQLSENFPGSIRIFAEAAGFGEDEIDQFYDKVAEGKVSADILGNVADVIQSRYGGQLPSAMDTLSAAFGRFRNQVFESALVVGDAGLIGALKDLFNQLATTAQTSEFQAFLRNIGSGIGTLINGITFLVRNFQGVIRVISILIGLRLTPFFISVSLAASRGVQSLTAFRAASVAAGGGLRGLAVSARAAGVAIRAAFIATGIGAIVVGLTFALGELLTTVDDATSAMDTHEGIVSKVRSAYIAAAEGADQWAEALDKVGVIEAAKNVRELEEAFQDTIKAFNQAENLDGANFATTLFGRNITSGASADFQNEVDEVIRKVNTGEISVLELNDALNEVAKGYIDTTAANARYAESLDEESSKLRDQAIALQQARDILAAKTGTTEEAAEAEARLEEAFTDTGAAVEEQTANMNEFNAALQAVRDTIPEASGELADLDKALGNVETTLEAALTAARALPDAILRIAAEQEALAAAGAANIALVQQSVDSRFGNATNGIEAAAELLRESEGFRATPYNDPRLDGDGNQIGPDIARGGFGSNTVTLSDGTIRELTFGTRVSVEDANRDLLRRITTEFEPKARAASGGNFDSFTAQQQASLISIAYNYGDIPDRIRDELAEGNTEAIADAIRGLQNDNGGINQRRRLEEAALFASGAGIENAAVAQQREAARLQAEAAREAERQAEAQRDFNTGLEQSIANQQFELSIADQNLLNREVATALREAELEAQAVGLELTEQQRQAIRQVTEDKFREANADDLKAKAAERTAKAEEEVNNLISRRAELQKQLEIFVENGNDAEATRAREEIAGINTELETAINNAIAMWEAIGGSAATAAIERLNTARLEAREMANEGDKNQITWKRVGEVFGGGLLNAFDNFAQSVANGTSIGEAARNAFLQFASDFLRQIAQMIIQQSILNAVRGATGGGGIFSQFLSGIGVGVAHTGGVVGSKRTGSGNLSRRVSPALFANAGRFHEGGLPGLARNEVATILQKGEEVVTEDDPRHVGNGGGLGQASKGMMLKIVNALEGSDVLDMAMQDVRGQEVILNYIRTNADAVKAALE